MINTVVIIILILTILAACYRGTVYAVCSFEITVFSIILAFLLCSPLSGLFKKSTDIYDTMLFYFEGHEYISKNSVEMVHAPVDSISEQTLDIICSSAEMPFPFSSKIIHNVNEKSYNNKDIYSLGDYFNETIVDVSLNILCFLLLYCIFRIIGIFLLRMIDFSSNGLPILKEYDLYVSGGIGLLHGVVLILLFFMLIPLVLCILPSAEAVLSDSAFGSFFYRANIFLLLLPSC